ncbi:MAG: MFS transporter [Solirubrobacteraceae bacterium]
MLDLNWSPERVRRNFRIDVFGGISGGAYMGVVVTFMPVVVVRMGGTPFDVALVVAAPFIGHLLSPLSAYLLRRLNPVRVVAATSTLARLVFLAVVLLAATPQQFAAASIAFWVIAIANIAAYTQLMAGIYPAQERAQAMSKVRMGFGITVVAAAAAAGTVIDVVPASYVFAAATCLSLPGAIAIFWMRYDPPEDAGAVRRPAGEMVRDVWADRRFRLLLTSFTVFGLGNLMNSAVYPILLVEHFDASNTFVGIMAAVQSATMIGALLFWGRRIDRGSSLRLTLHNTILLLIVPIGYVLAPSTWALLPVALVSGIVVAGADLTYHTNVVQLAPKGRVPEYAAAQSFLLGVRGSVAPFLAAMLLGVIEPRGVLLVGLGAMAAGTAVMARAVREPKPAPAPQSTEVSATA